MTTIYNIVSAELLLLGYNEFKSENNNQLSYFDKNRRIMSQLNKYDNETIIQACQSSVFYGLHFLNQYRTRFEKEFINHFLNRPFKFQTYETSRAKLIAFCLENLELIESIYNAENLLLGKTSNSNNASSQSNSNNRNNNLYTDLPQDNTGMNLEMDTMDYASNNTISKSKSQGESSSVSQSNSQAYSIDNLTKLYVFKAQLFKDIDILLFSQIF